MNKLTVKCPINSTSIGNVSLNILRELFNLGFEVSLFPVQGSIDLGVYDKINPDFKNWIDYSFRNNQKTLNRDVPTLQIWHINNSAERYSSKSFLYTFYELDSPTQMEVNICKSHDKVIFSSSHADNCFKSTGLSNTAYIPIGFDKDFFETKKTYLDPNIVHFGLMGKMEKRKHTLKILRYWAKIFGNDPKYQLSCAISNLFLPTETLNQAISSALEGEYYDNINFVPYMPKNSQVNEFINSISIDLTGLSGAEGWNLPSFNATCLGKWSCVLNCTSHKDWASKENSILVEPSGKIPAYDNVFFKEGADINQGNIHELSEESFQTAVVMALAKHRNRNEEGKKLLEKFSYKKSVNSILETIF